MRWTYSELMATPDDVVYLARQKLHHDNAKQKQDLDDMKNKSGSGSTHERRPRNAPPPPPTGMTATLDVPDDQTAQYVGPHQMMEYLGPRNRT